MKDLLKQIRNEWKRNLFLAVELLVVSTVLWYLVDWSYVTLRTYLQPMGFDTEHCYKLQFNMLTPQSDLYDPKQTPEDNMRALMDITERLRHRPGVEYVAISQNSTPYNDGANGFTLYIDSIGVNCKQRWAQPDFFRLFRYQSVAVRTDDGRTVYTTDTDSLAARVDLNARKIIVSRDYVTDKLYPELGMSDAFPLLGKDYPCYYPENEFRVQVAGIGEPIRETHFMTSDMWGGRYVGLELTQGNILAFENPVYLEVSLRLTPDADTPDFVDRLMDDADRLYQVGNVFLLDVQPYSALRQIRELDDVNEVRTQLCIVGFLLLNIFLGVIGTFWFRTQHRQSEVALRMAFGSTRWGVFSRLVVEGLLILTAVTVPAALIAFNIGLAELVDVERMAFSGSRFLLALACTWVLMAVMIVLGSWYPARRAMKVQPAEALHDE